jgi:hypothetical protein
MNAIRSTPRAADPRRALQCRHLSIHTHATVLRTWRGVRRQSRVTVHAYPRALH